MTINAARVGDAVRERLIWLQQHLEDAVRKAFAAATGLPERSSDIEEIDDLNRIDPILAGIVRQQGEILRRQDALAQTVAEIAARLREQERPQQPEAATISTAQRGQIYNLVLEWSLCSSSATRG